MRFFRLIEPKKVTIAVVPPLIGQVSVAAVRSFVFIVFVLPHAGLLRGASDNKPKGYNLCSVHVPTQLQILFNGSAWSFASLGL